MKEIRNLKEFDSCDWSQQAGDKLRNRFTVLNANGSLNWKFEPGFLKGMEWLVVDFHYESLIQTCFYLELREGEAGAVFKLTFSMLPSIQSRLRVPLVRLDQNAWALYREGGLLKRCCYGDRVQLEKVDRIRLGIERMAEGEICWEMGKLNASLHEPELMENPLMHNGFLVDEMGQSCLHEWNGKTTSLKEMKKRVNLQLAEAEGDDGWPAGFSRWGGWTSKPFKATGFFRIEKDEKRWWMVDPDGFAYWSAAMDCVRMGTSAEIEGIESAITNFENLKKNFPECYIRGGPQDRGKKCFDFIQANLRASFGEDGLKDKWGDLIVGLLKKTGFNGFGNWSEGKIASARGFPYVHPLNGNFDRTPKVFRDFPDVWHEEWEKDVAEYAKQLEAFRDDPALIGYFLMNEPKWGFSGQCPAEGMLFNAKAGCPALVELAQYLEIRYRSEAEFTRVWGDSLTFENIRKGEIELINDNARLDLIAFSEIMAQKFFGDLSGACRAVDPVHLNLGVRYYILPPEWLVSSMKSMDVFSMNCYQHEIPANEINKLVEKLDMPVMIGEWHFGALDRGLAMAGICRVGNQMERGKAYRRYLEHAASQPWCVGAHYFQLYDQPFLGRFDGENWNIGMIDVCHAVYEDFANQARQSHEVIYQVANGEREPFNEPIDYRERHFC